MPSAVRVAFCSVDPIGITTFSAFDPDSFSVTNAIADALVYIDSEGDLQPALATSWERVSPVAMEFELRQGVCFHDGSPFDAADVIATFAAHREPTPSACGGGILAPIVNVTALGSHRVRIETAFPDGMLLRRLFFGQIYSKRQLDLVGREGVALAPIGTGAYRFLAWHRGHEIILQRNKEHYAGIATADELRLVIARQKEWLEKLAAGKIDVAFNLDAHDAIRAKRIPGLVVGSRAGSVAQQFLLRNQGPLADVRVRRALNHAIHRRILVEMTEHGMGSPQRSVSTPYEEGYAEGDPFRYSPELARRLLGEAGIEGRLTLRGLVCETSTSLYYAVREFLSRVGVDLEADIVPLAEWMGRVVIGNLTGKPYEGDFAVTSMGNPLAHALFLQFANVFSQGPGSLTRDPSYDNAFLAAATVIDPDKRLEAVQTLERFAAEQAYMLFTVNQHAHAAWRAGFEAKVPLSGLPTASAFWAIRAVTDLAPAVPSLLPAGRGADLSLLLEGTSHAGTFYLRPDSRFDEPTAKRIWSNIVVSQERWRLQNEPLIRQLVSLAEAKDCLANVLDSTHRVAIVGYSDEGRRLFCNRGYEQMLGDVDRPVIDRFPHAGETSWSEIKRAVDTTGSWSRSVDMAHEGGYRPFFLTVTQVRDEEGVCGGYTFVFSDFSGEEERIKNGAIRAILDNVPYALFACDRDGRVLPGYSAACVSFFEGAALEGQELVELLRLAPRENVGFRAAYGQVIEDLLPEELNVAQLPARLHVGPRICDLAAAVMRDRDGAVEGVLFTLHDVTGLAEAEEEAERLRGIVQVLAFRTSFETFVRQLDADLAEILVRINRGDADEETSRRTLHTAKGVFGQFKLAELAALVHEVEDERVLTAASIEQLRRELRDVLERNASIWNIRLEAVDPTFSIAESTLRELQAQLAVASSVDEARALVDRTIDRLRQESIGELLGPIEASVTDHAARVGKEVRLTAHGLGLRVPLRLAPVFRAVSHLTRNAIDHAIELPEDRGDKDRTGTIRLDARVERDGAIVLEIRDDGRGIDAARLIARAIESGALTPERAATLGRQETLDLVFLDGVSTSTSVSQTSGRGVGMAAIKEEVGAAGGTLRIESTPGVGTRFVLRIPDRPARPALSGTEESALAAGSRAA